MVTVHYDGPSGSHTMDMESLTVVASIMAEVTKARGTKPVAEDMPGTSSCSFRWDGHRYVIRQAKVADVRAAYDPKYVSPYGIDATGTVTAPEAVDYAAIQGRYTVEFAGGEYETIRLRLGKSGHFAGKLIAAYLSGPDNDSDYQGFGHVDEHGKFRVWSRFNNLRGGTKERAVNVVLGSEDERADAAEAYARKSGNCARCGKTLTVPASLNRGYGPECIKHI